MFVQIITGNVSDRDRVRSLGERWVAEVQPGATGFLGGTIGVTDDGALVDIVRFESREAAIANSERAEQGEWWAEFETCLVGEPMFRESDDVEIYQRGDLDQAGFVQVMEGRMHDVGQAKALARDTDEILAQERPEILGQVSVNHPDGTYTSLAYFTSEAEAREGEAKQPSAELAAAREKMAQAFIVDTFLDLRDPTFI